MGTKSPLPDSIYLKLILVSGKTAEFEFTSATTALDVAKYVYENWPAEWGGEQKVDRFEVLRLIYQGRFLHGNVTLGALRLQSGKTTVMHLVPREHLPESNGDHQKRRQKHDNNNQDDTRNHSQRGIGSHRSRTTSPDSSENTGCCETCSIL